MKKSLLTALSLSTLIVLAACGNDNVNDENESVNTDGGNNATEENNGNNNTANVESESFRLGHNLAEDHPVHLGLANFAEIVEEESGGAMTIEIFPNAVLGDEREVLEQVQVGGVDMTKVSAGALENFSSAYSAFSLPYVFADEDHFFESMASEAVQDLYMDTEDEGFIGLTWYDSGARSFYTRDTPIMHPDDLQGLRIRVMDSQTQIDMLEAMGGAPTPMPYGEIYTALQQGVVDGAESNPTALTTGQHGEVAKAFSFDEHTRIPDMLVMSSSTWNGLSSDQQDILSDAAARSTEYQIEVWADAIDEAMEEAEEMGVEFYYPEQEAFFEAVQPVHEKYREDEKIATLLDAFEALR
ncbi:TRAP transporter substrate-binding protein [Bacillus sp. A301a_S52]|nr:TRAP transporter substrate-binding protein [Bacillus sp. A301a_S52]